MPLGVLLSGGLDSGSVAASLAIQSGPGVAIFTVRFSEPTYDEGPLARRVAERYKLNYHELSIPLDQLTEGLIKASCFLDAPLVHQNDVHLWAISGYAKPRVTVLLLGEGGVRHWADIYGISHQVSQSCKNCDVHLARYGVPARIF